MSISQMNAEIEALTNVFCNKSKCSQVTLVLAAVQMHISLLSLNYGGSREGGCDARPICKIVCDVVMAGAGEGVWRLSLNCLQPTLSHFNVVSTELPSSRCAVGNWVSYLQASALSCSTICLSQNYRETTQSSAERSHFATMPNIAERNILQTAVFPFYCHLSI